MFPIYFVLCFFSKMLTTVLFCSQLTKFYSIYNKYIRRKALQYLCFVTSGLVMLLTKTQCLAVELLCFTVNTDCILPDWLLISGLRFFSKHLWCIIQQCSPCIWNIVLMFAPLWTLLSSRNQPSGNPSLYTYAYFMSLHAFASQFLSIRSTLT